MQRYISDELAHFAGTGKKPEEQYSILTTILKTGRLSHPPHTQSDYSSGFLTVRTGGCFSENTMFEPEVVCFCDIPIDDLSIHTRKFSLFGLSFSKEFLVSQGAGPILYIPKAGRIELSRLFIRGSKNFNRFSQSGDGYVSKAECFNTLVPQTRDFIEGCRQNMRTLDANQSTWEIARFLDFYLFSFARFFDHRLPEDSISQFYMEREWRMFGNLIFSLEDVVRVLLPKEFSKRFRTDVPNYFGQVTFIQNQ